MSSSRRAHGPVVTVLAALAAVLTLTGLLATATAGAASAARQERWTPPEGVRISNPLGGFNQRRAVLGHLIRSIEATPRRGRIRMATWNLRSDDVVDALVRAHRRGVSVRVIVDKLNANAENPNDGVRRLDRQLERHGNAQRRPARRSEVHRCRGACRGKGGIAHSKFYLFSRVGGARWVVVNSSANATDLAASDQWNDAYTSTGDKRMYGAFARVFAQMWKGRTARSGLRSRAHGPVRATFYPYVGRHSKRDPVVKELRKVRCHGARGAAGRRTRIHVAMTAWHGDRGEKIAWKLRRLANNGCRIKIVYAVAGNEVLRILRREGPRPVPMRQIVQDFNGDRVYDRYLHTKVLTIRGRYGRNRAANITLNGSGNWTPVSLNSDEAVLRIRSKQVARRYNAFVRHLYRNPPPSAPVFAGRSVAGRVGPVDPYAQVEVN